MAPPLFYNCRMKLRIGLCRTVGGSSKSKIGASARTGFVGCISHGNNEAEQERSCRCLPGPPGRAEGRQGASGEIDATTAERHRAEGGRSALEKKVKRGLTVLERLSTLL